MQVIHGDHSLIRLLGHGNELAVGRDGEGGDGLCIGRPGDELLSLLLNVVPARPGGERGRTGMETMVSNDSASETRAWFGSARLTGIPSYLSGTSSELDSALYSSTG